MSSGLLALLDDVAALVKVTAASLDDIPAQVAKTTGKVSGIVIDDAAVTPKYVVGLDPSRELSIIYNIGRRSLFNKLVFLAPAALLMGTFAPWLIKPLLMVGGAYLCFEGYEKLHTMFHPNAHDKADDAAMETITPEELEKIRTDSAVKTDFILSAEIIAITYATVVDKDIATQIIVLISIAIGITVAVYGFVGLVVKADDIGLYMAKNARAAITRKAGRGLVKAMPGFLKILGIIGTAAMLWVGAEIIAHGVPPLHHGLEGIAHYFAAVPAVAWVAKASICALGGVVIGWVIEKILAFVRAKKLL
jgi:predicted DNA repair protein MutK